MVLKALIIILLAGAAFLAVGHIANSTPEGQAQLQDRRVIDECKRQMADQLLSASTREAARFMCNGLRDDYVKKYGTQP